ncbi:MAG: 2-C-methyl-D-erythritol 4-phosphate cytidylyltransferase, partial [Clostridia bacterium]|nr:2-C-methyl-D-erythritol 4-phosphate cytidylyltransferase [Clostridia bacterium]
MNTLLLMMGGSGTRFGADRPKQYTLIDDVPVFAYILRAYQRLPEIDRIVVVTHKDLVDYVQEWKDTLSADKLTHIVCGGATRSESVLNGLSAIRDIAAAEDVVLLHDATHPYVDAAGTRAVIEGVKQYGGATLGACQYDTVYRMNAETRLLEAV